MNILERIVETKRKEVAVAKERRPLSQLRTAIEGCEPPRDFFKAVTTDAPHGVSLIAEIKKASPSAGLIVGAFDPVAIARIYADHGAAALSVLTDETYFQGHLSFIRSIKEAVSLPVLRKDFLIDEYQLYEAREAGADAVLLIAEVLDNAPMRELARIAHQLDMTVLVEVHTEEKLTAVIDALGLPGHDRYLLGINNRDLTAQRTDLSTMKRLSSQLPAGTCFVAESGLATRSDLLEAGRLGACAVLVGESLLRADDIGAQVDALLGKTG